VHEAVVDLAKVEPCGVSARGVKIGDKPTSKVVVKKS